MMCLSAILNSYQVPMNKIWSSLPGEATLQIGSSLHPLWTIASFYISAPLTGCCGELLICSPQMDLGWLENSTCLCSLRRHSLTLLPHPSS